MMGGGVWWLNRRYRQARAAGEGYGRGHSNEPAQFDGPTPGFAVAVLPIVLVIGVNFALVEWLIPTWDTAYLATEEFGNTDIGKLRGLWAMIVALLVANLSVILIHYRSWDRLNGSLKLAANGSLLPTFNTASEVGYGTTIASLSAFVLVKNAVVNVAPGNPLISEMVAINVLAGITGSASGGLSIALAALGDTYNQLAADLNIPRELMHRIASMACGGFDTLPHNGAVITLLTICGLTHRQAYKDIAMVTIGIPFVVTLTSVLVLSAVY